MKVKIFLIVTIVAFLSANTAIAGMYWPESVDKLVAMAKASAGTVDMSSFAKIYEKKEFEMLLDVREPVEYSKGHIPSAINVPRGVLEFAIWPKVGFPLRVDYNKKIYIYCAIGGRASLAAMSLKELGFKNVVAVDMRFNEWSKAGHPVRR